MAAKEGLSEKEQSELVELHKNGKFEEFSSILRRAVASQPGFFKLAVLGQNYGANGGLIEQSEFLEHFNGKLKKELILAFYSEVCKMAPDKESVKYIHVHKYARAKAGRRKTMTVKEKRDEEWLFTKLKTMNLADIDDDDNFEIDREEMHAHFDESIDDPSIIDKIFDLIDLNGDGNISAIEFAKWRHNFTKKKLRKHFPHYSNMPAVAAIAEVAEEAEEAEKEAQNEDKKEEEKPVVAFEYEAIRMSDPPVSAASSDEETTQAMDEDEPAEVQSDLESPEKKDNDDDDKKDKETEEKPVLVEIEKVETPPPTTTTEEAPPEATPEEEAPIIEEEDAPVEQEKEKTPPAAAVPIIDKEELIAEVEKEQALVEKEKVVEEALPPTKEDTPPPEEEPVKEETPPVEEPVQSIEYEEPIEEPVEDVPVEEEEPVQDEPAEKEIQKEEPAPEESIEKDVPPPQEEESPPENEEETPAVVEEEEAPPAKEDPPVSTETETETETQSPAPEKEPSVDKEIAESVPLQNASTQVATTVAVVADDDDEEEADETPDKFVVNGRVWVQSVKTKKWRECSIVSVKPDRIKIHYISYDSQFDETLSKDDKRLRMERHTEELEKDDNLSIFHVKREEWHEGEVEWVDQDKKQIRFLFVDWGESMIVPLSSPLISMHHVDPDHPSPDNFKKCTVEWVKAEKVYQTQAKTERGKQAAAAKSQSKKKKTEKTKKTSQESTAGDRREDDGDTTQADIAEKQRQSEGGSGCCSVL